MKIPFEASYIPKIISGEIKVETKSGLPVKILCWDAKSTGRDDDIVALVTCSDGTTQNIADSSNRGDKDLYVILPDTPLKPIEQIMKTYVHKIQNPDGLTEDEITFEYAKAIMAMARTLISQRIPNWRQSTCDLDTDTLCYIIKFKHDGGDHQDWESLEVTNRLRKGEWYLDISDDEFLNLPKAFDKTTKNCLENETE